MIPERFREDYDDDEPDFERIDVLRDELREPERWPPPVSREDFEPPT